MALAKWRASSGRGNLLNEPLVLGDLFNPATFINALRQQTARKLDTAIDRVKMVCTWAPERDEKGVRKMKSVCPLPCTLTSLLLQGAAFSAAGILQEAAPEANELTPAPSVCVGFVPSDASEPYEADEAIGIPVFLSASREDFLMELQVPTDSRTDHGKWVLAGVALFLREDD